MKKLLLLAVFLVTGCSVREHFVKTVTAVQPSTVMVEVDTVAKRLVFEFDDGMLSIHIATVPATFLGAGVFISPNGHVLTCAHLFNQGPVNDIRVMDISGSTVPATLIYKDDRKDLGLLKVDLNQYFDRTEQDLPTYAILTKHKLQVGQEVIAIGNPLGLPFSVSHGIISAFRPDFDKGYSFTQDDAAINHGNSGGPLFNLSGYLIGINTLKADEGEGLSFAVSPETIIEFLRMFKGL